VENISTGTKIRGRKTMKQIDLLLLSSLRANARESLTNISRKTSIPVSTIFDKLRMHENGVIRKHTSIVDFSLLGFGTRANIALKVNKEEKDELKKYLMKSASVNSFYRINNGYDYLIEAIFRNILEMEEFCEQLEENFKIKTKQVFYIIEDLKREEFLADPDNVSALTS
jgi:DNA-binding Lrp family transcriptional regulator